MDTNKPLSIPYAVWLEKVVKTPLYQAMQPHIKFSEDGITLSQAEAVEQRTNELIQQEQQREKNLLPEVKYLNRVMMKFMLTLNKN